MQQNKALWKYFELLAEAFNEAGLDMKVVLKPEVAINWNKQTVHDYLWCPIQEAWIKEHSTTKLTNKDLNNIYQFLDRHLMSKFGTFADLPEFPSLDNQNFLEEYKNK